MNLAEELWGPEGPAENCVHCGRLCRNFDGGYASAGKDYALCHPNAPDRPDCYHMVTVYHHPLENCERCTQSPYLPLTAVERHDSMIDAIRRMEQIIQDSMP